MKCDINAVDLQFRTVLHWAAVLGLTEVVGILMERGASPNIADAVGATGLHYAVSPHFSIALESSSNELRFDTKINEEVSSHVQLISACHLKVLRMSYILVPKSGS